MNWFEKKIKPNIKLNHNIDICKLQTAFLFFYGILCHTLKKSRGENLTLSSTIKNLILPQICNCVTNV